MRYLIAIACLFGSVTAQAQHAKPKPKPAVTAKAPLPVFSFMGEDTEKVTTRTDLNKAKCTVAGTQMACMDFDDPKIAGATLKWLKIGFNNGKLYQVIGSAKDYSYDTIRQAFVEKYGQPRLSTKKWQSKGGASFDNAVSTWEFKGGELQLESMGLSVGEMIFMFVSTTNSPPEDKPKVDF